MKYRRKPTEVEANQFEHAATAPIGCKTREDGSTYVTTIHGDDIDLNPGDWVILEHDGIHAYPVKDEIFRKTYDLCGGD